LHILVDDDERRYKIHLHHVIVSEEISIAQNSRIAQLHLDNQMRHHDRS